MSDHTPTSEAVIEHPEHIPGYTYGFSLSGNSLELTASAIPEPSTYAALAGLSALALALYRKRSTRGVS